ncbi:uncharacterized protein METZ01_LOCUS340963, partial [marine metagenome]
HPDPILAKAAEGEPLQQGSRDLHLQKGHPVL